MQAKDIMTANVITVSEDTPVHEIVGLLLKYRISAVPVRRSCDTGCSRVPTF